LIVYSSILFFANRSLFYLFFVVKNNAVQYRYNIKWLVVSFNLGHSQCRLSVRIIEKNFCCQLQVSAVR